MKEFDGMIKGNFGATIRKLRTEQNISLNKFAKMVGISTSYLSQVETTKCKPLKEAKIIKMANILNVNEHQLLALAGKIRSDKFESLLALMKFDSKGTVDAVMQGDFESLKSIKEKYSLSLKL